MSIPVLVVSGFLGGGKTSFLMNLLPLCSEAGVRPALIINEVGDTDVDGQLLAELHSEQVKLVGGCVCCTLQSQLAQTIYDILDRAENNLIIIECSGLSNPVDVVSVLTSPALISKVGVNHIVCVVDSLRAAKILKVAHLAQSQVAYADIVILNKTDKITEEDKPALLELIQSLSSDNELLWATYGDIGKENLLRLLTDKPQEHECTCECSHDHHHHSHSLPASFCTTALHLPENMPVPQIREMLARLPENVIRAKGFAFSEEDGWQVLHKVYDSVDVTPLSGGAPNAGAVLICIGQHLNPQDVIQAVSVS